MAKFKVDDRVRVSDGVGTVIEVGVHDEHWFAAGQPQLYSVRLDPWTPFVVGKDGEGKDVVQYRDPKTGAVRGHEADTLGGVPEAALRPLT